MFYLMPKWLDKKNPIIANMCMLKTLVLNVWSNDSWGFPEALSSDSQGQDLFPNKNKLLFAFLIPILWVYSGVFQGYLMCDIKTN